MADTPTIPNALTDAEWAECRQVDGEPAAFRSWFGGALANAHVSPHALAAIALYEQPFGFTHAEVRALASCLPNEPDTYEETMTPPAEVLDAAYAVVEKLRALLPPEAP